MTQIGSAVFADLLRTIGPYLGDVVFVGGWVHALYVWEGEGGGARVIRTADIDVSLAGTLPSGDRPSLIDLLREGGFDVQAFDGVSGFEISKDEIDVDLLTEAPNPRVPVEIEGQAGLHVFGYPHQALLRDNARSMIIGPDMDEAMPRVEILVPTLPAYALGKLLSSSQRRVPAKRAKDLVYVSDVMARDQLRGTILDGLPELLGAYPDEASLAANWLESTLANAQLLKEVAEQVIEASGFQIDDDATVRAEVKARLSRLLHEGVNRADA